MNNHKSPTSCQEFELLISSSIDNEITYQERIQLAEHLMHCSACDSRQKNFQLVNSYVNQLGEIDGTSDRNTGLFAKKNAGFVSPKVGVRSNRSRWKRGLLTVSALTGAALFAFAMINFGHDSPAAKPHSDIIGPIVSLSNINSKRKRDQEYLRESLEFDLRTLKLQLYALNDLSDDSNTQEVLGRINRLMEKIDEAKIN